MEKRTCPLCQQQVSVEKTENKGELKFTLHRRLKNSFDDEENGEANVHQRNIPDVTCEGSGSIYNEPNTGIYSMINHRTLTD